MSIRDLEQSKKLKKIGAKLGRKEIAERALTIAKQILRVNSYKNAIAGIGRFQALAQCCNFDHYWCEKRDIGKQYETENLEYFDETGRFLEMKEVD